MRLAVVAIGYSRPNSLLRLLRSIEKAVYNEDEVTLIVSLDNSGDDSCVRCANNFSWTHGEKIVVLQKERQGLRKHILSIGKYLDVFDAIAVFEDDVVVMPGYYLFMKQAVLRYQDDERVAGISLYSHRWNFYANLPFTPIKGQGDVFFMQIAQSWGQIWLKKQWKRFEEWLLENPLFKTSNKVHPDLAKWPESSWLKYHIKYCADNSLYFVYPYYSFTTCMAEAGEHTDKSQNVFQLDWNSGTMNSFILMDLDDDNVVRYDAFFENLDLGKYFNVNNVEIDLYGQKSNSKMRYLLSSKKLDYAIVRKYGCALKPHEANIINEISGNTFFLYDVSTNKINDQKKSFSASADYYFKLDSIGVKQIFVYSFEKAVKKIKYIIQKR